MQKRLLLLPALLGLPLLAPAQWTSNPLQNTVVQDAAGTDEVTPLSAAGPAGSTWVSWFELTTGGSYTMRLQRLDANGNKLLGPTGLLVSNQPQSSAVFRYDLKSDAAGNALLAFQDLRSGAMQCVVYKISPGGAQLWGANGIQLLAPDADSGLAPTIGVLASGNVVVAWSSGSVSGPDGVAFQKFSPAGVAQWPTVHRLVETAATTERAIPVPSIGDEFIMHYVRRTGFGLGVSTYFAQRYSAAGTGSWAAPVQASTRTTSFAYFAEPVSDGAGGYYMAFNTGNPANAALGDVYVQRVRADGTLWSTDGSEALSGTSTARFDGRLQFVPAQNKLYLCLNSTNSSQSSSGINLQSFDPATGAVQLGANGTVVMPVSSSAYAAQELRDTGTGLIVVFTAENGNQSQLLQATKASYTGTPGLFPTGSGNITLSSAASAKLNFSAPPLAAGQLVVVWADRRTDDGVYAQPISDDGQLGVITATATSRSLAQPLHLAPNPGGSPLVLLPAPRHEAGQLLVRDGLGRLVHQQAAPLGAGSLQVLAPQLQPGIYWVELRADGQRWQARWLKE